MEVNRIFSAEQIVVKPELPGILKDYSKALLSLIHISEPTRQAEISYAVFCLKKKSQKSVRADWISLALK